ncbi:MAG: cobalamin biosynthesis protein CbiM [Candidatus Eisenbacteria bacterium]|nr:cobalamin biosynthesis protein CbiM [Candidatus Eisenbacteria bacterium]
MHIPDGFIAPQMYLPAYACAAGLWLHALRRVRAKLREETIPLMAVLTAVVFVLMSIALPLPGGTSAHASGVAILAILFGVRVGFLLMTLVLLLQALILGAGGITSLPINALAIGGAGALAAVGSFRLLRGAGRPRREALALITAGWVSVVVPAALVAIALGVQPALAHAPDGTPRFFPFGLAITVPALVVPHLLVGVGEGALTLLIYRLVASRRNERAGWQ